MGAVPWPWAGNNTALRSPRRAFGNLAKGDVTRHIACLRRRLSRIELVDPFFVNGSKSRCADHQGAIRRARELIN